MFCRNCGSQLPDDTKFCSHCGAAQDNAAAAAPAQPVQPAQPAVQYQPSPAAAPKKNPLVSILAVMAVVAAILLGALVIAPALSGNKNPAPNTQSAVTQYKHFEVKRAENDYCTVFLRYKEDSDCVAEITFDMMFPADATDYAAFLNTNESFEATLKSENIPTDLVEFADVELADGVQTFIKFNKLDEGNPSIVALVEEHLDLPAQNDYLYLDECEQYLLDAGFELVDQN